MTFPVPPSLSVIALYSARPAIDVLIKVPMSAIAGALFGV